MTTAETVRVLEHVSATVKGREDKGEEGWRVQLDIPSFKTKYPTVLNFVASDMAAKLVPNTAVNLVLVRDKLRTDSNGKSYDGKWKWHYWWRLDSFWDGKQQATSPVVQQAQPSPEQASLPAPRQSWDDRTVDIEAAWAINQARELLQYRGEEIGPDSLVQAAQWFLDTKLVLTNAMRSGVHIEPAQEPQPEAQGASQTPAQDGRELVNAGEVFEYAVKILGYANRQQVLAVPGVEAAMQAKKYHEVVGLLTAAKKAR